jgi:hypothetical protein
VVQKVVPSSLGNLHKRHNIQNKLARLGSIASWQNRPEPHHWRPVIYHFNPRQGEGLFSCIRRQGRSKVTGLKSRPNSAK